MESSMLAPVKPLPIREGIGKCHNQSYAVQVVAIYHAIWMYNSNYLFGGHTPHLSGHGRPTHLCKLGYSSENQIDNKWPITLQWTWELNLTGTIKFIAAHRSVGSHKIQKGGGCSVQEH